MCWCRAAGPRTGSDWRSGEDAAGKSPDRNWRRRLERALAGLPVAWPKVAVWPGSTGAVETTGVGHCCWSASSWVQVVTGVLKFAQRSLRNSSVQKVRERHLSVKSVWKFWAISCCLTDAELRADLRDHLLAQRGRLVRRDLVDLDQVVAVLALEGTDQLLRLGAEDLVVQRGLGLALRHALGEAAGGLGGRVRRVLLGDLGPVLGRVVLGERVGGGLYLRLVLVEDQPEVAGLGLRELGESRRRSY